MCIRDRLHEVLTSVGEDAARPHHPLISHVPVAPYSDAERDVLCDQIREVAPGWISARESRNPDEGSVLTLRQVTG